MKALIYGKALSQELKAIAHLMDTIHARAKARARAEYAALCAFRAHGLRAVVVRVRRAYLRAQLMRS